MWVCLFIRKFIFHLVVPFNFPNSCSWEIWWQSRELWLWKDFTILAGMERRCSECATVDISKTTRCRTKSRAVFLMNFKYFSKIQSLMACKDLFSTLWSIHALFITHTQISVTLINVDDILRIIKISISQAFNSEIERKAFLPNFKRYTS